MNWYKDRDFPEIKIPRQGDAPNVIPVSSETEHIERIIELHNDEVFELGRRIKEMRRTLIRIADPGFWLDEGSNGVLLEVEYTLERDNKIANGEA